MSVIQNGDEQINGCMGDGRLPSGAGGRCADRCGHKDGKDECERDELPSMLVHYVANSNIMS